jgi:hypothetical protein
MLEGRLSVTATRDPYFACTAAWIVVADPAQHVYRPVRLTGRFLADKQARVSTTRQVSVCSGVVCSQLVLGPRPSPKSGSGASGRFLVNECTSPPFQSTLGLPTSLHAACIPSFRPCPAALEHAAERCPTSLDDAGIYVCIVHLRHIRSVCSRLLGLNARNRIQQSHCKRVKPHSACVRAGGHRRVQGTSQPWLD